MNSFKKNAVLIRSVDVWFILTMTFPALLYSFQKNVISNGQHWFHAKHATISIRYPPFYRASSSNKRADWSAFFPFYRLKCMQMSDQIIIESPHLDGHLATPEHKTRCVKINQLMPVEKFLLASPKRGWGLASGVPRPATLLQRRRGVAPSKASPWQRRGPPSTSGTSIVRASRRVWLTPCRPVAFTSISSSQKSFCLPL